VTLSESLGRLRGGRADRATAQGPGTVPPTLPGQRQPSDPLSRKRVAALAGMLGPAFVAAIAYVDPGNFATNFGAGARFGYALLWVVLAASLIAMPVQYLSAKLGIVTGKTLPQACRDRYGRPTNFALWIQAELVAMATDLAEFVGAVIGMSLVFGAPLWFSIIVTAALAFAICGLQSRGYRPFELAIGGLLAIVVIGFLFQAFQAGPSVHGSIEGLVPSLPGGDSVLFAVGIIGATVMPHAIYLHSSLVNRRVVARDDGQRRRVLRFERIDVVIALSLAAITNMSMLAIAAKLFDGTGGVEVDSLEQMHDNIGQILGGSAALAFAVALLASGISSSSVGTVAGQVVMDGYLGWRIPLFLRRALTMAPAIALLLAGVDPGKALVVSQVCLSFGIPFALIPLLRLTADRKLMGDFVNARILSAIMSVIAAAIVGLNLVLLKQQFLG
jgi:manganese transport protein